MRALVTGGAGFIGSHLVDALVARGEEVHVLDNLATGSRANLASAAELHDLDIRDDALEQVVERVRPEVVFHLAAQADVGTSVERPLFDADVNVLGTVRVLEAARAIDARVVFTSSGGAIYGECERPETEIFGDGSQTRDCVYVGDVVGALFAAGASPASGIFNVGSGIATTVLELHRLCAEAAGVEQEPRFAEPRPGDLQHSVIGPSRAASELGWHAAMTLAKGLAVTWNAV